MKCPICNGKGYQFIADYDGMYDIVCEQCKGKGEVDENGKPIFTNEEYLRSAGTDGITAIFMQFMFDAEFKVRFINGNFVSEFRKWLKEKHE